jgi:hypothetical protein
LAPGARAHCDGMGSTRGHIGPYRRRSWAAERRIPGSDDEWWRPPMVLVEKKLGEQRGETRERMSSSKVGAPFYRVKGQGGVWSREERRSPASAPLLPLVLSVLAMERHRGEGERRGRH